MEVVWTLWDPPSPADDALGRWLPIATKCFLYSNVLGSTKGFAGYTLEHPASAEFFMRIGCQVELFRLDNVEQFEGQEIVTNKPLSLIDFESNLVAFSVKAAQVLEDKNFFLIILSGWLVALIKMFSCAYVESLLSLLLSFRLNWGYFVLLLYSKQK